MAMNFKYNTLFKTLIMALLMVSCGVNYIEVSENPEKPLDPDRPNGAMSENPIWGTITDANGTPLEGVTISSGDCTAFSNEAGFFYLERIDVVSNRAIVRFSKEGYFPVVRSCFLETYTNYGWEVAMAAEKGEGTASVRFSAQSEQKLSASGMTLRLPSDGYYYAGSGRKFSGMVNAKMFYLSPQDEEFISLMPGGDLIAGSSSGIGDVLVSYGMINVLLADDLGNQLQLGNGAKATVEFPIVGKDNSSLPAEIPLWSFDESTGTWMEEGMAMQDGAGYYVGEVSHFTWWNLDTNYPMAWIEGCVTNDRGERLSDIEIIINNQLRVRTNESGWYRQSVYADYEFEVKVPQESYGNYTPEYCAKIDPIPNNTVKRHDIILPSLYYVYGSIEDENGHRVNGAYRIKYPGGESGWISTDENGNFKYYLIPGCYGKGSISVVTVKGSIEDQEFEITGKDNIEVILKVKSGTVIPDQPDIVANCGGENVYYLSVKSPSANTFGGVIIEDSYMTVVSDFSRIDDLYDIFILQIPNYTPNNYKYSDFKLIAIDHDKLVRCENGELTIKENDGMFYYTISGLGEYGIINTDGSISSSNIKQAEITVNNVGITHLMTLERKEDYTLATPLPALTPHLSSPAPVAMLITKSEKLGTGGFLYYNGTLSDFDNLTQQAEKTSYICKNYEKDHEYGYALYLKDKSGIEIEADTNMPLINTSSWRGLPIFDVFGISEDDENNLYPFESQIIVRMYNGGTISIADILSGENDDYTRNINTCAKQSRKFSKLYEKTFE